MKAKTLIASSILAVSAVASSMAMAESAFTGNIGVTSNYIWRGLSQTDNQAAIQGGLDYENSGFYVGTWLSNVSWTNVEGYEMDIYAGYGFDLGPTSWDVGYIAYTYPLSDPGEDFSEVYLNFGWTWLSAGIAYNVDSDAGGDDSHKYYYVAGEWEVGKGLALGALIGSYDFDGGSEADYDHGQLYLTKDDFTFALDKTNAEKSVWSALGFAAVDDLRATVSWSKAFDL
ncbi:MAG: hypothetical protein HKM94_08245 [Halobacteria archaeon]|nr:hypothetical protein [Halobacteria archaeon]